MFGYFVQHVRQMFHFACLKASIGILFIVRCNTLLISSKVSIFHSFINVPFYFSLIKFQCLVHKNGQCNIRLFSNQVWIFYSTNWSNVIFGFPAELSHGRLSKVHKYNLHNWRMSITSSL